MNNADKNYLHYIMDTVQLYVKQHAGTIYLVLLLYIYKLLLRNMIQAFLQV